MEVLVLSNSDTTGKMVAGTTWTARLAAAIAEETGEVPSVREVPFAPVGGGAASYAAKKLIGADPDVAVVPIGTYAFSIGFVSKRIERLFGRRAADWYRRREYRFDNATRDAGTARRSLNHLARRVARRTVGVAPLATVDEVIATYLAVFGTLAAMEQTLVVAVIYPNVGGQKVRRERALCAMRLRAEAERLHFGWVDAEDAMTKLLPGEGGTTPDGIHMSEAGHRELGRAVGEAVLPALMTLTTDTTPAP